MGETFKNNTHHMKLYREPFAMIVSGVKDIELRLNDEKRRCIRVGDTIVFTCGAETVTAEVIALHRFSSFAQLYQALPLERCGYTREELDTAKPEDMYAYYTRSQEMRYGVLGIELAVKM